MAKDVIGGPLLELSLPFEEGVRLVLQQRIESQALFHKILTLWPECFTLYTTQLLHPPAA